VEVGSSTPRDRGVVRTQAGGGGRRAGPRVPSRPRRGHLQRMGEAVGWRWGRGPRGIGGVVRTEAGAEGGTEGPVAASARPPPTEGGGGGRVEVGSSTPRDRGRRADGSGRGGKGAGPRVPSRPRRGHLQRREGEAVGWRWGRGPRGIGSSTPRDRGVVRTEAGAEGGGRDRGARRGLGEATSNGGRGRRSGGGGVVDPAGSGASCGRKRARREGGGTEGPVAASARPPPTEGGGGGRVEVGSSTPRDRGRRADGSGRGGKGAGPRVPSRLGEATSNGGGPGGVGPLRGGGSSARRSPLCPGRRAGRVRWSRPWRGGGGGRVRSRLRSVS
jgi:hypothetical protein